MSLFKICKDKQTCGFMASICKYPASSGFSSHIYWYAFTNFNRPLYSLCRKIYIEKLRFPVVSDVTTSNVPCG